MTKVLFSVGHYPEAQGATVPGAMLAKHELVTEHVLMTQLAWYTMTHMGTSEYLTISSLKLSEKIEMVNGFSYILKQDNEPHFAMEIHVNAGGGRGISCYHYHGNHTTRRMAKSILTPFREGGLLPIRGIKGGGDSDSGSLGWLSKTSCPALLLEVGFIDSENDLAVLTNAPKLARLGEQLARGLRAAGRILDE